MAPKLAVVWLVLFFLATSSFAQTDCPPLDREGTFGIYSQADADKLKKCPTFKGDLNIFPRNQSSPIILDGPVHIIGELHVRPPFYLKSLVTVSHAMYIEHNYGEDPPASDVGALEFPVLKLVGFFWVVGMTHVNTINLPCLEKAGTLNIGFLPLLHSINVPKLKDIGSLNLMTLPSLKIFSFSAGLQNMGGLEIYNTSLESIGGLTSHKTSILDIHQNKNLNTLSFPFMAVIALNNLGLAQIRMRNNSDNFFLDLPRLKGIQGRMTLSGLAAVNIPELTYIDKELNIGAIDYLEYYLDHRCSNCFPTTLTNFTAPKLTRVPGSINFDSSPALTNISFPALRSVGGISINNTAAVDLPNGISMPLLKQACNVQIIGTTAPNCTSFDELRDRGVVKESYFCGSNQTDPMPATSSSCADLIKTWSEVLLVYYEGTLLDGCMSGYTLNKGSEIKIALLIAAVAPAFWYVWRRWHAAVKLIEAKRLAEAEAAGTNTG